MQVAPVGMGYSQNYSVRNTKKAPTFGALDLSQAMLDVFMPKVADKCTFIYDFLNPAHFLNVVFELTDKYPMSARKSIGMVSLYNSDVVKYFSKTSKIDLKDKVGLCLVVGDKFGPVEEMGEYYESRLFLSDPINMTGNMAKIDQIFKVVD